MRLLSGLLGLVLFVSRILLSVLLFAGAFTKVDGRPCSRSIAQKIQPGKMVIKRFPFWTCLDTIIQTRHGLLALGRFFHRGFREGRAEFC